MLSFISFWCHSDWTANVSLASPGIRHLLNKEINDHGKEIVHTAKKYFELGKKYEIYIVICYTYRSCLKSTKILDNNGEEPKK